MPSKCKKCHFRDPHFKMGFQTYIFCSKVPSKCRKCHFRDPNFKTFPGGACHWTPLQLCHHYGLPLTKILATPLTTNKVKSMLIKILDAHQLVLGQMLVFFDQLSTQSTPLFFYKNKLYSDLFHFFLCLHKYNSKCTRVLLHNILSNI